MEKYNLGPAWVLTANSIEDPVEDWVNLGFTRGNIVASIVDGKIVTNTVDQLGSIPIASAVFRHPDAFQITMPLLDKQIDVLLQVAPGSVKLSDDGKEAFALPTGIGRQGAKAFCIVPVDQFEEGKPWWKAEDAIWLSKGIASVSNQIDVKKEPVNDDLGAYEVTVTQVDAPGVVSGIGAIWLASTSVNPVGLSDSGSFQHAVPNSDTRSALSFSTVRAMINHTGSVNVSGGTLTDLRGLEYAIKASSIDVSGNSVSQANMSAFISDLWKNRKSLGDADCVIDISGNNGVNAEATAMINGTGKYNNDGLVDAGCTVTT